MKVISAAKKSPTWNNWLKTGNAMFLSSKCEAAQDLCQAWADKGLHTSAKVQAEDKTNG